MSPALRTFFQRDRFAAHNGIELLDAGPGWAKARLNVGEQHLNAADVVHGGALFALADLVFAVASNSHGRLALGINVSISYLKAARGPLLTAEAKEVACNAKLATYSMEVCDAAGDPVALAHGTVYRKATAVPV
ncbi:MAG: PaaI family thioesterase [Opitutaceae bacterium]